MVYNFHTLSEKFPVGVLLLLLFFIMTEIKYQTETNSYFFYFFFLIISRYIKIYLFIIVNKLKIPCLEVPYYFRYFHLFSHFLKNVSNDFVFKIFSS